MAIDVTLPRQSEKLDESLIVFWHVAEGDTVEEGDILVEVQTEKVVTEIESPASGIIQKIKKQRGDSVKVDEVLAVIGSLEESSNKSVTTEPVSQQEKKAAPRVKKLAKSLGVDWKKIEPTSSDGKITEDDVRKFAEEMKKPREEAVQLEKQVRKIIATPSVRKLAREHDVDLEDVVAFVNSDRITREDVERFIADRDAAPTDLIDAPQESTDVREKRIPLTGIRKTIARNMTNAMRTIPHVTHFDEANVEKLVALRTDLKDHFAEDGVKLTYLPFIVKALTTVLQKYPFLNANFDEKSEEIVVKEDYHIGIAVDTERGLLVPVIRNADKKSVFEIAKDIQKLAEKANDGTISPDEMTDGTCTISNVGSARGSFFTPIINAPQTSILGIGRIEKKAVVINDTVEIKPMMALSLSYDHRLIDGVLAQEAMNELKVFLEEPGLLLAKGT